MINPKIGKLMVFKQPSELAQFAAQHIICLAKEAIEHQDRCTLVLAGGTTPKAVYELLADHFSKEIEWNKVFLFLGDERFVPNDHKDSTYLMVKNSLLNRITIPAKNIFPVPTFASSVDEAARLYNSTIVEFFGNSTPKFDLVLLGMGPDGHTASLFPTSPTLISKNLVAAETNSPKPPLQRITLTYRAFNGADNIVFMITGADKAHTLREVLGARQDFHRLPAQGIRPHDERLLWLVDKEAASQLD
ncbi:MAG: 6-phosphogluconolactonase [Patescibacteria group bacterium]|nr:6-phosphogluconolactonase [Patescibacteria group bacterium]